MVIATNKTVLRCPCAKCGSKGTVVQRGIDIDNRDALVVECTACGQKYELATHAGVTNQ